MSLQKSKFYTWKDRYGKANEHNAKIPRDHWTTEEEKQAIIDYHTKNPLNGYRRLCYMMIDDDVAAVSPSTVRNTLKKAGLMDKKPLIPNSKGTGFNQPSAAHKHWHTDVTYLNLGGTFYYFSCVLDGFSRYIVHWEIRESMKEEEIEMIIQRALEKFPGNSPRIISDNGPQYVSRDFKEFIRLSGMTHVRTSPYYPQSNGKVEAFHKSLKQETIRPACPETYEEAVRLVEQYVQNYNEERLHSALGYITPKDKLEGKEQEIHNQRDRKLEQARERRACARQMKRSVQATVHRAGATTVPVTAFAGPNITLSISEASKVACGV